MRVMLYEGKDTTGLLGEYESDSELSPGIIVAIPSGATYRVNSKVKNTTSITAETQWQKVSIFCEHLTAQANSEGAGGPVKPGFGLGGDVHRHRLGKIRGQPERSPIFPTQRQPQRNPQPACDI